jgi:hypothetical protein
MQYKIKISSKLLLAASIQFVLLCTAIGAITGFGWAAISIRNNGYISLGFWKTIFYEIYVHSAEKLMWGAIIGVACILFRTI